MATSYSTNLALALPATGELSGTWGTTVNSNITNMLDEALGYQAFSATGGSDTLTIPDGTTGVARSIYIQLNGTGGGTVNVPTAKTKMYFVFNNTASAITFKVTGQTGVSIPAAAKIALVSNGTDIIVAENYFSALTLGAALPVASGGTSLATLTANNVILGNGTSAPTFVAPSTSGNVLTSNGTTWASTAPATGGTVTSASVVTANGFAGTVATATTTPAITLTTSITGVLKGNATAISAAVAGTDYVTPTGTETLTNKTVEAGTFTNGYTEEVFTGNSSTAITLDLANGTVQIITLTGNCVYTFPTPVAGKSFTLIHLQDATGSRTVTWPATVDWPSATAPTLTATALQADKFVFTAISGTSWLGSVAGQNYTV